MTNQKSENKTEAGPAKPEKKIIPHPHAAGSNPLHHLQIAEHAIEQIKAGHYGVRNVSVTQHDNGDGSVRLVASFDRYEVDPKAPAADHGLELA